ncbi:UNVERIFIED_ORG: hypothetical protein J2Y81_007887 [Paraburkholderia sediminicola]|nr:hypothetical protein [Paraburkholderia sediminicola]
MKPALESYDRTADAGIDTFFTSATEAELPLLATVASTLIA